MLLRVYPLALATFVSGIAENICVGILPSIAHGTGVSLGAAGQLITLFSVSFALSAPLLLAVTGRAPRRLLLVAALIVFGAGNVLAGVSQGYAILLVARLLTGSACALICLLASTLAAEIVPAHYQGRAIGIVFMGICGSLVLGVPIGVWLADMAGWRAPFFALAALSALTALLLRVALPVMTACATPSWRRYLHHLGNPALLSAQAVSVCMIGGHFVLFAYLTPYLQQQLGFDDTGVGIMYLLFGVGGVTGGFIGGWLSDWLGRVRALVLSPVIYMVLLASLATGVREWAVFVPLMMLWGCLSWTISPIVQNYLIAADPANRDVSISLNISAMHLGVALGAWLGGFVINAGGSGGSPIAGLGVAALAVVAACVAARIGGERVDAGATTRCVDPS